jgi:hypothetical protein
MSDADAAVALSNSINATPCEQYANESASESAYAKGDASWDNVSGEAGESASESASMGSKGCDTISELIQSYKTSHQDMSCAFASTKQTAETNVRISQSIDFECDYCDVKSLTFSQTIDQNALSSSSFTDDMVKHVQQVSDDFLSNVSKVINKSESELGNLPKGTKNGASMDSVLSTTKQDLTNKNTIQSIINKTILSETMKVRLSHYKGDSISLTQQESSKTVATNVLSSTLAVYLSQFDKSVVKTAFDLQNSSKDTGLASLASAWISAIIVPVVLLIGLMVAMGAMKKGGGAGGVGGMTDDAIRAKKKSMAITLLVVGIIVILVGIVFYIIVGSAAGLAVFIIIGIIVIIPAALILSKLKKKTA